MSDRPTPDPVALAALVEPRSNILKQAERAAAIVASWSPSKQAWARRATRSSEHRSEPYAAD